jgi:hypothetical protein
MADYELADWRNFFADVGRLTNIIRDSVLLLGDQ